MLFYPVEKYLSKYTDTLITINQEDYELAKKKFSKRCRDIQYVPGVGIDADKFNIKMSDKDKNEFRNSLGLKKDDFVLTCIARLDKNKNQGFLIDVIEKLNIEHDNIHLLLAGPDEIDGVYAKKVLEKNLVDKVHFLGMRRDIAKILSITDIVVSASYREGLPVNVMEAFAAGKPVVTLNCRGMSELIDDGVNGFIIDINDKKVLEKYCESILNIYNYDNSNLESLKKNNINKVKNYSTDVIISNIEKIYFRKKRILHLLASNSFSGAENVACTIISNLFDDYDMVYCSPDGPIKKQLNDRKINYESLKKLSFLKVKKVIKKYNPDVIHAHDLKASFIASVFYRKCVIISHLHKNDPQMKCFSLKSCVYNIISRRFNKVVGVSDSILNEYYFKSNICRKYMTINNYVDRYNIVRMSSEKINLMKIDCCFLGRLVSEKNPFLFIDIIKNLSNDYKNISAIMIGDGPLREECLEHIKKLNLSNNIKMIGYCDNPFPYLKCSRCCILPSKYEGFGLSALESLILNVPVLNSGVGGLKSIFINDLEQFICKDLNDYVNKYNHLVMSNKKFDFSDNIERFINFSKWRNCINELYK